MPERFVGLSPQVAYEEVRKLIGSERVVEDNPLWRIVTDGHGTRTAFSLVPQMDGTRVVLDGSISPKIINAFIFCVILQIVYSFFFLLFLGPFAVLSGFFGFAAIWMFILLRGHSKKNEFGERILALLPQASSSSPILPQASSPTLPINFPQTSSCPVCGKEVKKGARFCPHCGVLLDTRF
jgi:hypothetical protein